MALFGQNWPKFGLNLAISGYIRPKAQVFKKNFRKKFWKKFFFLIFFFFSKSKKNYFGRQKSTFYPYEHHYWPKLTQIWPKFGHIWLYQAWSTGVQKNVHQKIWKLFLVSRRSRLRPKYSRSFVRPKRVYLETVH